MKVAYIAHPIGGDVDKNVTTILAICRQINKEHNHIVPFAPYITDVLSLNDGNPNERTLGLINCRIVLERFPIDELWLCGDRISEGMMMEKEIAQKRGITVRVMSYEDIFKSKSNKQ